MASLRVRAALAAMVIVLCALVAIAAVVVSMRASDLRADAEARQSRSLIAAAAVLDAALPELSATVDADGVRDLRWSAEPDFEGHALIDRIGASTGETATVFAFEPENGDFWRRTTNIRKPDGSRAVGTQLGSGGAVHAAVMRGETFRGRATILGHDYLTVYAPIRDASGDVAGILYVGAEVSDLMGTLLGEVARITVAALAVLGLAVWAAWAGAGAVLRPLEALRAAMAGMADGDYETRAPATERPDEIGLLARGAEALRLKLAEGAARQSALAAAEERAKAAQAAMLASLRDGVSQVVDAAVEGDFSRRVTARFQEPELESLAGAVNRLAEAMSDVFDDMEGAMEAMADRDLSRPMREDRRGRFGKLGRTANASMAELGRVLIEMRDGAQRTGEGMRGISGILSGLSDRVESQASTLQETAATIEEISGAAASTAGNLTEAERMTEAVALRANGGAASVGEAIAAVRRIEESSTQITEIIAVIESIAFQTNLLALNAAVEAARAGDAGKGFAVVASEVRSLAQRSSEAARNITDLIKTSAANVADGVSLVDATGASLAGIVSAIDGLAEAIRATAAAGREQGESMREINSAVGHLDATVQENARQITEAAAEASSLAGQAQANGEALAGFRTGGERRAARPSRAA